MHIRDEAHRFGVTFHRKLREKSQTIGVLNGIKGIGNVTETILLQHFKTVDRIKKATLSDLAAIIGEKRARILLEYFENAN